MAQRFGGKYSPEGTSEKAEPRGAFDGARLDPVGLRANLMFIPPLLLGFLSLNDGAIGLATGLVGAALLILGAWLLREGLRAEAAFDARKVARRPSFPRKMAAALLAGLGIALAAYTNDANLIAPIVFGLVTTGLHLAAFGVDPMKSKGMEGIDTFQQDRVARAVDEAEKHLKSMSDAIARAGDRQVEARVERFQTTARDLFRTVEEDPRDLTGARKYLTVYLLGARDASIKFADIYARQPNADARADYLALLDDLEENFAARTRKMLLDDHSDLTVEIDVLRDRLQREGVKPE
ncbi:MAG: 5-bromo-4-chloroindolyl phosphate hydrolysis family protein [Arenibacterium sp.]